MKEMWSFPGGTIKSPNPMKPFLLPLLLASALPVLAEDVGLLIQLGLTDTESTDWDGRIKVTPGEVQDIAGWRFEKTDALDGKTGWKASTRSQAVQGRTRRTVCLCGCMM